MASPSQRQILILDPPTDLRFRGPFTREVTTRLELRNPSARRVCFKLKSTSPRRYCVRPSCGVLEPGASVTIAATLQPCRRHPGREGAPKLMVQTVFAPSDAADLEAVWKEAKPGDLMDSKLRCVFEMPDDNDPLDGSLRLSKATHPEKPGSPPGAFCIDSGPGRIPVLLVVIGAVFVGFFLGKFVL